jgi:hypothetical protein
VFYYDPEYIPLLLVLGGGMHHSVFGFMIYSSTKNQWKWYILDHITYSTYFTIRPSKCICPNYSPPLPQPQRNWANDLIMTRLSNNIFQKKYFCFEVQIWSKWQKLEDWRNFSVSDDNINLPELACSLRWGRGLRTLPFPFP